MHPSVSALLCAVLLVLCGPLVQAWTRDLQATNVISNVQVPYNVSVVGGDPLGQLPLTDPRLQRTVTGLAPEQARRKRDTHARKLQTAGCGAFPMAVAKIAFAEQARWLHLNQSSHCHMATTSHPKSLPP